MQIQFVRICKDMHKKSDDFDKMNFRNERNKRMSHNNQKKIAVINDISGFGRCSIAVALPIISAMKIQCCILPTSIFSNHSGFESFFFDDYTDKMQKYIDNWKKLDLKFNGIATGFLGSRQQIGIVSDFLKDFVGEDTTVIIDPVMGDYGKAYSTYTDEMCRDMIKLVEHADIITPNLTEACILTETHYKENMTDEELYDIVKRLSVIGPEKIVITGLHRGEMVANLVYESKKGLNWIKNKRVGKERSGTGDIFASIIAADAVNGVDFEQSVKKASDFIMKCISKSIEMDIPDTDGVCFEEYLTTLT